jgi:hypothetical protein
MAESPKFAHRSNPNGTSDSICFRCIATVARVHDERELLRYEQQPICDPALVERSDCTKPPSCGTVEDSKNCNSQILASRNDLAKCVSLPPQIVSLCYCRSRPPQNRKPLTPSAYLVTPNSSIPRMFILPSSLNFSRPALKNRYCFPFGSSATNTSVGEFG